MNYLTVLDLITVQLLKVATPTVHIWYMFLVLSPQQEDPDDGNLGGLQAHEIGHDEVNIKEATDPGRKVGRLVWFAL